MEGVIPGCQGPPALVHLGLQTGSADTQVNPNKKGLGCHTEASLRARTATFKLHQQILKLVCHQSQCEYHADKLKDES